MQKQNHVRDPGIDTKRFEIYSWDLVRAMLGQGPVSCVQGRQTQSFQHTVNWFKCLKWKRPPLVLHLSILLLFCQDKACDAAENISSKVISCFRVVLQGATAGFQARGCRVWVRGAPGVKVRHHTHTLTPHTRTVHMYFYFSLPSGNQTSPKLLQQITHFLSEWLWLIELWYPAHFSLIPNPPGPSRIVVHMHMLTKDTWTWAKWSKAVSLWLLLYGSDTLCF